MKLLITAFSLSVLTLIPLAGIAQCPAEVGVFTTLDGTLLAGRMSEAWCNGMQWESGNVLNTESWDGAALGTQWKVYGMAIDADGAVLLNSELDQYGNGYEDYSIYYDGGEFWLTKDHTWGDGVNDLYGAVEEYHILVTITYIMGNPVGLTTNATFNGAFLDCDPINGCGIEFAISNSNLLWRSDSGDTMLDDFPALLCGSGLEGEQHDMPCLTYSVSCLTGTQSESWGGLKTLYR